MSLQQIRAATQLLGAGAWTSWTPTWTGFSTVPVGNGFYTMIGKTMFIRWYTTNAPQSNATFMTATLPDGKLATTYGYLCGCLAQDNDQPTTSNNSVYTSVGSNILLFYYGPGAGLWTASAGKSVNFSAVLEVQ